MNRILTKKWNGWNSLAGEGIFPKSDGDTAYASDFNRINIKMASATWTTAFSTTSTSYVDVTDATVTLSGLDAAETYDLYAIATGSLSNATATAYTYVQMVIDGTATTDFSHNVTGADTDYSFNIHGFKSTVTGATSYIAKLQSKVGSGTGKINRPAVETCRITLIAFPKW